MCAHAYSAWGDQVGELTSAITSLQQNVKKVVDQYNNSKKTITSLQEQVTNLSLQDETSKKTLLDGIERMGMTNPQQKELNSIASAFLTDYTKARNGLIQGLDNNYNSQGKTLEGVANDLKEVWKKYYQSEIEKTKTEIENKYTEYNTKVNLLSAQYSMNEAI